MGKRYFDPRNLKVGDMVLDDVEPVTYYGVVTLVDKTGYIILWNNPTEVDVYPYWKVSGLEWRKVIQDKKKQLEILLRCDFGKNSD